VTLSEALAIMDRQAMEGAWSYGVLYDARASLYVPTADDLVAMATRVGVLTTKYGPRGPVALVVGDSAHHKVGRRYASLGELTALDVRVFTTLDEAESWLDASRT
jgi:hypothetical protein